MLCKYALEYANKYFLLMAMEILTKDNKVADIGKIIFVPEIIIQKYITLEHI